VSTPGNFTSGTGFAVDGFGSICAGDSTHIQGPLNGTVDICDLSPTVSDPPFIDEGAQFVGPDVTFCLNSSCATNLEHRSPGFPVHMFPLPATDRVTIDPAGGMVEQVSLYDVQGRIVRTLGPWNTLGAVVLDVSDLCDGTYVMRLSVSNALRILPLVIVR
jgi:hypothetical protein